MKNKQDSKVPIRVIALNALQLLGIFAATLAVPSPEASAVLAMLPGEIGANIGKIALFLVAAKPAVNLTADLVDNGKLDKSWKGGGAALAFLLMCSMLTGCGVELRPPDAQGCYLIQRTQNGKSYAAGPCAEASGHVYAYRSEWRNGDGVAIRATYNLATKKTVFEYRAVDGTWIKWGAKSGIILDGLPPSLDDPVNEI